MPCFWTWVTSLCLSEAYAPLWLRPFPLSCTSHFLRFAGNHLLGWSEILTLPPLMFVSIIPPSEAMATCYSPLPLWREENPEYTQGSHENTLFFFPKSWLRFCKFLRIVSLSHLHRGFWSGVTTGQARSHVCRTAARNVLCFAFFLCFLFSFIQPLFRCNDICRWDERVTKVPEWQLYNVSSRKRTQISFWVRGSFSAKKNGRRWPLRCLSGRKGESSRGPWDILQCPKHGRLSTQGPRNHNYGIIYSSTGKLEILDIS